MCRSCPIPAAQMFHYAHSTSAVWNTDLALSPVPRGAPDREQLCLTYTTVTPQGLARSSHVDITNSKSPTGAGKDHEAHWLRASDAMSLDSNALTGACCGAKDAALAKPVSGSSTRSTS